MWHADYMYDVRFALDGAITCRVYQAGYMQAAYWDPGKPVGLITIIVINLGIIVDIPSS